MNTEIMETVVNEAVEVIAPQVTSNGWDCLRDFIKKVPVETIEQNAPLWIVVGGACIMGLGCCYIKCKSNEKIQAMKNSNEFYNDGATFTEQAAFAN